jgi:hypothetical protein
MVIEMKHMKTILIWAVALTFITLGLLKYVNLDEMTKPIFDRANYPKWFFYAVGTIEFIAGIMLLMTATVSKRLGSILIALVMLGAMGTRYILHEPFSHFVIPGIIFFLAVLMSLDIGRKGHRHHHRKPVHS